MSESDLPDDVKNPPKFEAVWPEPEVLRPDVEVVQAALPLEFPEIKGYIVEFRKGDLHALHTEKSTHADDLDAVTNIVKGYRKYPDQVTWSADSIIAGTCRGLAPEGVVYEICVTPAVTIDA